MYWSDSIIPSTSANSIQVMKMCEAFTNLGHITTLHAKKPNKSQIAPNTNLTELYGVSSDFKVLCHSSHRSIKHIDYDFTVSLNVLKAKPDLIYTRSLRGALSAHWCNIQFILELHFLPTTKKSNWILKKVSKSNSIKKIVVISQKLKDMLLETHPYISEFMIEVHHDAIDIERFADSNLDSVETKVKLNLNPSRKIVMYVGHLYEGRGIDLIEQLAQTLPEIDFIIIGGTEKDVLYRKSKSLQMGTSNLVYYGFIPNSKLHYYYAIADLLIMPYQQQVSVSGGGDTSQWMSPMKTFEYMASGKPLISSDIPVLREVLDDEVAILVEADKLEEWKSSIQNTLTNTQFANRISGNAKRKAQENTWVCRAHKILGK